MVYVFDIDGTISSAPTVYAAMMKALVDGGHRVLVLTGALSDMEVSSMRANRVHQLQQFGVLEGSHFHELKICVDKDINQIAIMKAQYCFANKADMFIDDLPPYLWACSTLSPLTARLQPHKT